MSTHLKNMLTNFINQNVDGAGSDLHSYLTDKFRSSLTESAKTFQMKIESSKIRGSWKDITFKKITSLEKLAKEISSDNGGSGFAELRDYLEDYHIGQGKYDLLDVVDQNYDVQSFKDDVLKISYSFTARMKDNTGPKTSTGVVTLMPSV